MRVSTAFNHLKRLESKLRDIYSRAKSFCLPHSRIIELLGDNVWEDPALQSCPQWVSTTLSTISQELLNDIQRNWVIWLHEDIDGSLVEGFANLSEEGKDRLCQDNQKWSAHYWIRLTHRHGKTSELIESDKFDSGFSLTRRYEVTSSKF